MTSPHGKPSALARLRNYFLTGFVVLAPLALTVYLVWSFIGWVDGWVKPYIPSHYNPDNYLPIQIPGFGLIVAIFVITLIGFLTANIIGRTIIHYGEHMLGRMPLVRSVYRGSKQILETVLADKAETFKKAGLIQYPRKGVWGLVFIATDMKGEIGERLRDDAGDTVAVFIPTTPNPTSGFVLFVPKSEVVILDMSVEDAAKLVISAGLVTPEYNGGDKAQIGGKTVDAKRAGEAA